MVNAFYGSLLFVVLVASVALNKKLDMLDSSNAVLFHFIHKHEATNATDKNTGVATSSPTTSQMSISESSVEGNRTTPKDKANFTISITRPATAANNTFASSVPLRTQAWTRSRAVKKPAQHPNGSRIFRFEVKNYTLFFVFIGSLVVAAISGISFFLVALGRLF
ncbi:hypothetical protein QR680_012630 [Steinernema hermaphroditum]|uniref:Uncharacterized protein n=1 Tax=Steinernema hermaphroditum TaxID=289476 RepID=A0AA39I4X6_9BILA|nr:hypothetical protein QR680_012630 [Steinernema hermaphroditum]